MTTATDHRVTITPTTDRRQSPPVADAFVIFGITGDLAKVKTRQDGVEECWRVMDPLLKHPPPVHPYAKGSWGPQAADQLLSGYGRWHAPWVAS